MRKGFNIEHKKKEKEGKSNTLKEKGDYAIRKLTKNH